MTDIHSFQHPPALPQWPLDKIPLPSQGVKFLCEDEKYRDTMITLYDMSYEVALCLNKCRRYHFFSGQRMPAIDNIACRNPQLSESVADLAKETREAQDKVTEAVREAEKTFRKLLLDIRRVRWHMNFILGLRKML
ncbi:MAG: hypothetical protein Q9169_003706 [Polycauliona sp. 2 TL-2023]